MDNKKVEDILRCGMSAGYNVDLALRYGVNEAILLNRLIFLHQHNKRKDGFTWQTAKDWHEYTGLSDYQVRMALKHLVAEGILEVKNTYIIGTQIKCRHQKFILECDSEETSIPDSEETSIPDSEETYESESKETYGPVNSCELSCELSCERTFSKEKAKADEILNDKRKKETYADVFNRLKVDDELREAFEGFIESRKANKKTMTSHALELGIKKVRGMSGDLDEQVAIVNQSVENCWQGLFPLKEPLNKAKYHNVFVGEDSEVNRTTVEEDVDELFKVYEDVFRFPLEKSARNIAGAKKLIESVGIHHAEQLVGVWFESLKDDESKYFGVIRDFGDLSEKYQGLIMWSERRYNEEKKKSQYNYTGDGFLTI